MITGRWDGRGRLPEQPVPVVLADIAFNVATTWAKANFNDADNEPLH